MTRGKQKYGSRADAAAARRSRDAARYLRRVDLGLHIARWRRYASDAGMGDEDFAGMLLDRFESSPRVPEVPNADGDVTIGYSTEDGGGNEAASQLEEDSVIIESRVQTGEDYVPSEVSMREYKRSQRMNEKSYRMDNLDEILPGDLVHSMIPQPDDDQVDMTAFPVSAGPEESLREQPCIAYLSCLLSLAPELECHTCKKACNIEVRRIGSATIFLWICKLGHTVRRWSTQPRLKKQGVNLGDFMLATNILLSGNNYTKVALMFRFMGMKILSDRSFYQIQRLYCVPAIDMFWTAMRDDNLNMLQGQHVILAGDGRNDSPGHCAQFCTYSMMDHDTGRILCLEIVDKREVEGKSPNMEKLGAQRALRHLLTEGIEVTEVVTDAHVQISAMMKNEFPDIEHQLDTWHGSKNLTKKLHAVADKKGNQELKEWIPDISNHFWYCSSNAEGSVEKFLGAWGGILKHTTGTHEWFDGAFGVTSCQHEPMDQPTDGKTWLKPGGPAHKALANVITDKAFVRKIPFYTKFRHTGGLEVFNQHILMYAAKRYSFTYPVYTARNQLAAIDFNQHVDRPYKLDDAGQQVYRRVYNKRRHAWYVVPLKVAKKYTYIQDLQRCVLEMREQVPGAMSQPARLSARDPRHIAPTLAGHDIPDTSELAARHVSRLSRLSTQTDH